jgi:hypothetical protein
MPAGHAVGSSRASLGMRAFPTLKTCNAKFRGSSILKQSLDCPIGYNPYPDDPDYADFSKPKYNIRRAGRSGGDKSRGHQPLSFTMRVTPTMPRPRGWPREYRKSFTAPGRTACGTTG